MRAAQNIQHPTPKAFRYISVAVSHRGVPEGHLRIAQRFSVGKEAPCGLLPEGTADAGEIVAWLSRPFGTRFRTTRNPTLKHWAIVACPFGTKDRQPLDFLECISSTPRSVAIWYVFIFVGLMVSEMFR